MNILKHPECADQGAILTKGEFEELAIQAGWMEDLMDRDDLGPHDFLDRAVSRANAIRTPQNLYLWVTSPTSENVFLVQARLQPGIHRSVIIARSIRAQVDALEKNIRDLISAGGAPL